MSDQGGELQDGRPQLPDDLVKEAHAALKKVGAYLGSNGDTAVMESFKDPPTKFALIMMSLGLLLVSILVANLANYVEIKRHWAHYRCDPSITPFARFYGHSLEETMQFCVQQSVKQYGPSVTTPIYEGIEKVSGVIDGVYNKVESIEGGITGLLRGFEGFIVNFLNSFRLLGTRVRMIFIRLQEIFSRVHGIFIAFAYAAISAITFGQNIVCNPLVTFIATIAGHDVCCFAPMTRVRMWGGGTRPIHTLTIGDRLETGARVTSTYLFDGSTTPMVEIAGVHVSGNHALRSPTGTFVPAAEHPLATPATWLPYLWCISTSDNRIPIESLNGPLLFTDYEESDDPFVVAAAQLAAEEALNGTGEAGPVVADYSLGLDPTALVQMYDGHWKLLEAINVGDRLMTGGYVTGRVREECHFICITGSGIMLSAAQLVYTGAKWVRAAQLWPVIESRHVLSHLTVSDNRPFVIRVEEDLMLVRDYHEYQSKETQAPYDAAVAAM